MALVKHNNNSISDITSAGQLAQGKMTLISEQTASGSASISFTSGIDSTYPIYKFEFINIHPSTNDQFFVFNGSSDSGSNYNLTKTTTFFEAQHNESDSATQLSYRTADDIAQGTGFQRLLRNIGNGNDENASGYLYLFDPSNTTFVKHFMGVGSSYYAEDYEFNSYYAGYFNTTSAIDSIQFKMESGNMDSGIIKMYGVS